MYVHHQRLIDWLELEIIALICPTTTATKTTTTTTAMAISLLLSKKQFPDYTKRKENTVELSNEWIGEHEQVVVCCLRFCYSTVHVVYHSPELAKSVYANYISEAQ